MEPQLDVSFCSLLKPIRPLISGSVSTSPPVTVGMGTVENIWVAGGDQSSSSVVDCSWDETVKIYTPPCLSAATP
ncbi:hypothetical protein D4764_19G0002870 [Takifugu flavidus]|uniref:Uncharacterized protein n=1 Tax=Takifugu flavidus TaxID=433684 RepID=A0A5C6NP72_9TELE|nr:hypothetical protein D4764_19G0002870 [Takifugu flavidus]